MVLKFKYDNSDHDSTMSASYTNRYYCEFISRLLREPKRINRPLILELSKITSHNELKYNFNMRNFFFFSLNKQVFAFDAEFFKKQKSKQMVNFNLSPGFKLSLNNRKYPFTLAYKYYEVQPSRGQIFEGNDFSQILNSFLPYDVHTVSLSHSQHWSFLLFNNDDNMFLYKTRFSFGKILGYEDFYKMCFSYKVLLNIPLPVDWFSLALNTETTLKKSFIKEMENKKDFRYTHIISNYDSCSKLIGIDTNAKEGIVDNGSNIIIHNLNTIRFQEIKMLQDIEIINRIEPYIGLETIYNPKTKEKYFNSDSNQTSEDSVNKAVVAEFDYKDFLGKFTWVYCLGFSLKLDKRMYLDFIIKTDSNGKSFDINKVNRFRIGLEVTTNL